MTKIADWDPWKQTLTQKLQAGDGLTDIVAVEGDAMPQFLSEGASDQFVDLSDSSLDDRWVEYAYKAGQTADGKQIGYPTDAGPEAFCYRADLFEKAGLPSDREDVEAIFETWDTYFAAGEQLTAKLPDTKWYDSSGSIAQAMLNQAEFPFQTADNTIDVENPELELVWDTVTGYSATLSPRVVQWKEDWTANFTNDGFATMPCPGWMFSNIKSSAPDVEGWDIANAFPGGGGNWGGSFLAVPAHVGAPRGGEGVRRLADRPGPGARRLRGCRQLPRQPRGPAEPRRRERHRPLLQRRSDRGDPR